MKRNAKRRTIAKTKQAHYYNKTAKDLPRQAEGTVVRIQLFGNMKLPWKKGIVRCQEDERSYEVTMEDGGKYRAVDATDDTSKR